MIINFKVNGDTIKTSEKETFYTGNVNSYICEFEFSEDWDKAAAFCVMTNGKKSAVLYIADSKCTVPSEILSGKGTVKLGLYGTDGNKRISTNCVMLKVREGAYEIGEDDMTMPIPDVWEQLVSKTVPKIGDNGNWLVWSMTENKYVDTGIYATVDIGEFYKKSETDEKLSGKVDKITGKGLSTNDYTDEEKEKLKGLSNYDDTEIKNEIGGKVDKVQGKGLSSNDYTAEEKTKLSDLPDKQGLDTLFELENNKINAIQALATQLNISKVDKEDGKGLSANDFTNEDKEALDNSASYSDFQRLLNEVHTLYGELNDSKEDSANKTTTLDENSTDTQYPSAKATYDELVKKLNTNEAVGKRTERHGEVFNDYANNVASGSVSHAEGSLTSATGICSHAEGSATTASGNYSHSEGRNTAADGISSHAEGLNTVVFGDCQHVQGKNNIYDTDKKYAHIVGNGTESKRSNAHTLDWDGNTWYKGKIKIGGTSYDDGKTVETETTISTSTETTPSITLSGNTEVRCAEITSLTVALPETISDSFISSVIFKSGATATTVTVPSNVYCQGADCKNGAFLPKANKRYTMIFSYDGIMNCYISAVPIQTAETQSADDFPAANDESVADPTESVTEEPESEPNEVI